MDVNEPENGEGEENKAEGEEENKQDLGWDNQLIQDDSDAPAPADAPTANNEESKDAEAEAPVDDVANMSF